VLETIEFRYDKIHGFREPWTKRIILPRDLPSGLARLRGRRRGYFDTWCHGQEYRIEVVITFKRGEAVVVAPRVTPEWLCMELIGYIYGWIEGWTEAKRRRPSILQKLRLIS
jgi:hypothetical protein